MFYFFPDKETLQKGSAAENPSTKPETLEQLASDEHPYVRRCVARNPNTSQKVLQLLACDGDWVVRNYVAENPNKNYVIERLLDMTEKVCGNKETPIESFDTFEFYTFLNVASVEELEGNYLKPETLTQILTTK
jgi:hypothetical protein